MRPEIAIIDSNTLAALGLKELIHYMKPKATIRIFSSFISLVDDTPDMYVHYFVSSQIYLEHVNFFIERKHKTIVLINSSQYIKKINANTLNVCQPKENLIKELLQLYQNKSYHSENKKTLNSEYPKLLTPREIEVLKLAVKGLINKEIASKLNIGLNTVLTHRKNITEKLNIKSISGLTIYAVMNGYIELDDI